MGRHQKEDPVKYCLACGSILQRKRMNERLEDRSTFLRRKFCNHLCFGASIMKDAPTLAALRKRHVKFRGTECETCATRDNLGVHHVDSDPSNNIMSNLMTLCGPCHTSLHWANGKKKAVEKIVGDCKVCGERADRLKMSMCGKHYQRSRRTGSVYREIKSSGKFNCSTDG